MERSIRKTGPEAPGGLAVVTGASAGLGAEFARQLALRGHDLLLVARRRDRLDELAAALAARHGVRAEALAADLSSPADLERVAARLRSEPVELLVNNAGFGVVARFFEADFDSQERMVRVHVDATLRLTHAVLPGMIARDRGAVVNVSSLGAYSPLPGNGVYCGTKSFLLAFTRSLDLDLASRSSRVRVQVLCPGFTRTEFHAGMQEEAARIPRSIWMSAAEVVEASLRGLDRGRVVVVPGWRNKLGAALMAMVPAWAERRVMSQLARRTLWPQAGSKP